VKVAQSPGPQPAENMRPWLLTVTRNYCFDVLRHRKAADRALAALGGKLLATTVDPESAVLQQDTVDTVLSRLNPRERTALWQSAVEHRGPADIAKGLNLTYMAAAKVVSRARRHAALVAAAVAALLVSLRPQRITSHVSLSSATLIAATAIPIVALMIQPSSTSQPGHPATLVGPATYSPISSQPITTTREGEGQAGGPLIPIGSSAPPIPPAVGRLLQSTTGYLYHLINQSPTPAAPPLPAPTASLPSVPVLPTPTLPPHP
jgi:hypothetical protein